MYYYIKGKVTAVFTDFCVVEQSGIGYKLFVSGYTQSFLSMNREKEITVYTYLAVSEDAMDLYGFSTEDERNCFIKLIAISGVGPKAALSVLTAFTPQAFSSAILAGDAKSISRAKGIGLKTAQKIILELKGKLEFEDETSSGNTSVNASSGDAINALTLLGYTGQEARKALDGVSPDATIEEMISYALSRLNRF